MDPSTAAVLGGVVGAGVSLATTLAWRVSERDQGREPDLPEPLVPVGAAAVLSVLRSSALLVGPDDDVLKASAPAHEMGLVKGSRLAVEAVVDLVRQVRRDGHIREAELELRSGRDTPRHVVARVAPLSSRLTVVLVDDRTRERRVEAIRQDFAVNVSHELKTPVGALALLSEAVREAAGDPEAVQRFSARMRTESERLTRLVQQIIELSRVQGDSRLEDVDPVSVDVLAERAMDRVRVDAADKRVELTYTGSYGLRVAGNGDQLAVALGNLVENAVAYSPPDLRVTITARPNGSNVDISVTDQGTGIPQAELGRIFERFYRVDPARARATGGTGLGLSIVKHIVAIHGGEVTVWSAEGQGSTFTLSVPAYVELAPGDFGYVPAAPALLSDAGHSSAASGHSL
ncbi:MAG: two-component sensor histidine kinase [Propionibacteriales bacterium]|nr:two-component sensor histidine kinase [Propionibacteriales bacterium]